MVDVRVSFWVELWFCCFLGTYSWCCCVFGVLFRLFCRLGFVGCWWVLVSGLYALVVWGCLWFLDLVGICVVRSVFRVYCGCAWCVGFLVVFVDFGIPGWLVWVCGVGRLDTFGSWWLLLALGVLLWWYVFDV